MTAKIKKITLPPDKRVICISDIHGNLDLFQQLLQKVQYCTGDILILLGDLYTKGTQGRETLSFLMSMQDPNVHILRGNCDWIEEDLEDAQKEWLENLPHIIESENYLFVHGGLTSADLSEQNPRSCMKCDAFMEQGLVFDKYVVTGHWPTVNYSHHIPAFNPMVHEANRIIAIDGGNVLRPAGQLNAFMICGGQFSYDSVDSLPRLEIKKAQTAKGGNLNTTWLDRFVEMIEEGPDFSLCRHMQTGQTLPLPTSSLWRDGEGRLCECSYGTDYYLPVSPGDRVSVVAQFGDRIYAKKDGIAGWIEGVL